MILGLPGHGQGADSADQPQQHERRIGRRRLPRAPRHAVHQNGQPDAAEDHADQRQQLRLQSPRRQPLDEPRRTGCHDPLQPVENALAIDALEQRHRFAGAPEEGAIQHGAADQRCGAHDQRQVESVPDREAVCRRIDTEDRVGRQAQEGADGEFGKNADQHARRHQQPARQQHPARRIVRLARQICGLRAEKDLVNEAQRVGDTEHPRYRRGKRQEDALPVRTVDKNRFGEEHFLGQKTIQKGYARHRRRRHHRQRGGNRHRPVQPRQARQIARAGLVVDDARSHEQRGLEGRVVENVEHGGNQGERAVHAEQQGDEPEMADCRIGQHALHVLLEDREVATEHQRAQAGATDDPEPRIGAGQHRPQARQQEYAGLHHGRRMQIRRDRRRCRHRVRQPEMEGKLRALGQRAQRNQAQHQRVPRMRLDRIA